eukprot:11225141-Lingulodinium_polyedra.AAC.1
MMRLGTYDMLYRAHAQGALVAKYYAELNDNLAETVQRRWRYTQEHGLRIPRVRPARDIWGLHRRNAEPLR